MTLRFKTGPTSSPQTPTTSSDNERGASVASVMIILAIVFMFFELIVMGGRVAAAYGEVNGAAREAARQGSVAQTPSQARDVAELTADANLDTSKRSCVESNISFGGSFSQDGHFTVALSCRVDLGDFSILGIPWPSKTFASQATEIVETYRAVG